MMSQKQKRTRSSNFSMKEKTLLIEQVKLYCDIIENKALDPNSHKRKLNAWKKISSKFQSFGFNRSSEKLKDTYQRMKHQAKVNIRNFNKSQTSTGSGPIPDNPSDLDYAIMDISPKDFIFDGGGIDSDFFRRQVENLKSNLEKKEVEPESVIVDPFSGELSLNSDDYLDIRSTSPPKSLEQSSSEQPLNSDDCLVHVAIPSTSENSSEHQLAIDYGQTISANSQQPSRVGVSKTRNEKFSAQTLKKKFKLSAAEGKLMEYYEMRIENLKETHSFNLVCLRDEEERKKQIAQKELEKKELEIQMLKQQLKQQNDIHLKNLEIKDLEIMNLKKN